MPSAKYVRGYLSSIGIDSTLGDAFCARCDAFWGAGGWDIGPAGVSAAGGIVVLPADYVSFVTGTPKAAPAAVAAEPDPVEDDDRPVSRKRHR